MKCLLFSCAHLSTLVRPVSSCAVRQTWASLVPRCQHEAVSGCRYSLRSEPAPHVSREPILEQLHQLKCFPLNESLENFQLDFPCSINLSLITIALYSLVGVTLYTGPRNVVLGFMKVVCSVLK